MGFLSKDEGEIVHRRYQLRKKLISIGDDYWIEDDQGHKAFRVDGKKIHVRDTWILDDATWQPSRGEAIKRRTEILVANGETVAATVYDRAALPAGFKFSGPAIVEQSDTTTLVSPGWRASVDAAGALILEA